MSSQREREEHDKGMVHGSLIGILVGTMITSGIILGIESCTRDSLERAVHRCVVAGVEHGCIRHSERTNPETNGEYCRCRLPSGAKAIYEREVDP